MLNSRHVKDYFSYVFSSANNADSFSYWTTAYKVAKFYKEECVGKRIVVTGCNGGIGYHSACAFAEYGAELIMACRDSQKSRDAFARITKKYPNAKVELLYVDTSNFLSIQSFVDQLKEKFDYIDILLNNAGIVAHSFSLAEGNGFEKTMATNFLGPVLLTELLEPFLRKSPCKNPRVVNVSSISSFFNGNLNPNGIFTPVLEGNTFIEYGRSKYFLTEYTKYKQVEEDLREDKSEQRILYLSLHPGVICTEIHRDNGLLNSLMTPVSFLLSGTVLKNESQGGACSVFCCLCSKDTFLETCGGGFFADCKGPCQIPGPFNDASHREELYKAALDAVFGRKKPCVENKSSLTGGGESQ